MNWTVVFRRIYKNRKYFLINTIGLSLALISVLLVYSFVSHELSYDTFHSKSNRIYRVTKNTNTGISSMIDARFFTDGLKSMHNSFPQIEAVTGLSSFRKSIVTIENNSFYSEKAFRADSSFFEVFDFELFVGDKKTLFRAPYQAAITESLAKTYFGTTDVIGKQLKIMHQRNAEIETYTIKGVLKDFPKNSHFKADILCSYDTSRELSYWAYSYLLLKPNTNYKELQSEIQDQWDERYEAYKIRHLVDLQPLEHIHLHSRKTRELERNGNLTLLILLLSGAFAIIVIAFINFINLNYVQFLSEQKNIYIRVTNGASRFNLAKSFLSEVLILMVFVVFLSFIIINYLPDLINIDSISLSPLNELVLIILIFVSLLITLAYIPYFYNRNKQNSRLALNQKSYQASLLIQISLSIVAIVSTLFLQKQINYFNELHPQSENADIIVMPKNAAIATENFETLKAEVLKHPEIISACAVSEEPAGAVVDNFAYTYNGDSTDNDKTLNVLIVDNDFFSFMNIEAIAGSLDLGVIPSYEWEQKALQLWVSEAYDQALPENFNKEEITNYREKYIINRTALKHMGIKKPEDAIGKGFQINHQSSYLFPKGTIIGVVDDFHYTSIHEKEKPLAIMPRKIYGHNYLFRINPERKTEAISIIKEQWKIINKDIPFQYEFITDSYQKVYQSEYHQMKLVMGFAFVSILLSMIGMYAMISYKLNLRTKEIGIRKVNGASVSEIINMLNLDFLKWVILSFIIAVPLSYYAMTKWLENFAYKTELSWWVFVVAGLITVIITLFTISWQTIRIAIKNPIESLKYE